MKQKKKKKGLIIAAIIVAAVVVGGVIGGKMLMVQAVPETYVQMQEIKTRDLSEFVSLQGTVLNENKVNYSSCAGAEVLAVNVQVGDEVKAGDVLVELDTEDVQTQLDSANKSLSNSQGMQALEAASNQQSLSSAVNDKNNQLTAASQGITDAQSQYDLKKTQYDAAVATRDELQEEYDAIVEMQEELIEMQYKYDHPSEFKPEEIPTEADITNKQKDIDLMLIEGDITERADTLKDMNDAIAVMETELLAAESAVTQASNNYASVQNSTDASVSAAQNSINSAAYSGDDSTLTNQIAELNKQLEACTVTAVADGIVTKVNVAVGDVNTPNTVIITVENDEKQIVEASVSEKDILKLQEGMAAVVTSDAIDGVEIPGEVVRVVRVAEQGAASVPAMGDAGGQSSGGGFSVQIALDPSDLLSGMSAKARITISGNDGILCVPYDLVQTDENGKNFVLIGVANEDGTYTAERRDITIGEEYDYYVEVKGGDVAEGDFIIMDYGIMEGDTFISDAGSEDMFVENGEGMVIE